MIHPIRVFVSMGVLGLGVTSFAESGVIDPVRPNVLFIAIDDLNASLQGMNGEVEIPTPNINRLAERGVLFTNAHCAAPACSPSRVSVMTGQAPTTSGIYYNWQDWRESESVMARVTLPQHFRNHGYTTMGGGKIYHAASIHEWGFTGYMDARPWDEFYPSKTRQLAPEVTPEQIPLHGSDKFYGGHFDWAALDIETNEMGDAKVVQWASDQLSQVHENPLFLAVGIYRPHIPWYTPAEYFTLHPLDDIELPEVLADDLEDVPPAGRKMARQHWHQWIQDNDKWREWVRAYRASVSFADVMVGQLLDALDAGPMADNTVIVLWSDHGYHLGQKEHWEKFALWEQTTRVPLIVATPRRNRSGEIESAPATLLDIYPTLIELARLTPLDGLDGVSFGMTLNALADQQDRVVVTTQGPGNHSARSSHWRYTRYADGTEELYDQVSDSRNFHNLAEDPRYHEIVAQLANHLPKAEAEMIPADKPRR